MRSESEVRSRLFLLARMIDSKSRDTPFYEGAFFSLLWILDKEELFRKELLPARIRKSVTGKVVSLKSYERTLEKVFSVVVK